MEQESLDQKQLEEINTILTSLNRMKRLNNNLLLLSKIRNNQFIDNKEININETIKEVLDNFEGLIDHKNITLSLEEKDKFTIRINPDLAHIMITNLIKNAIVHNVEGGELKIKLSPDSIIISNDGLKPEHADDIFSRYYSHSDNKQSLGLGLSLVKSVIDLYNLDIEYKYDNRHTITIRQKKIK